MTDALYNSRAEYDIVTNYLDDSKNNKTLEFYKEKGDEGKRTKALMPKRDRVLLSKYLNQLQLDDVGTMRRIKVFWTLFKFRRDYLAVDFEDASLDNLKEAVTKILNNKEIGAETKNDYKKIVKAFYRWVDLKENHRNKTLNTPARVSWITTVLKKRDKRVLRAEDLLTEEEAKKIISNAADTRGRCFLALAWETGARVGELANLKLKDVVRIDKGFRLELYGKTGHRSVTVYAFQNYISSLINEHPDNDNPNAHLFLGKNTQRPVSYTSLKLLLVNAVRRAGIKKRVYLHLWRHSLATEMLGKGYMNETQAKKFFGWTADSRMIATYSHLTDQDVDEAVRRKNGIEVDRGKEESKLKPVVCICKHINDPLSKYCANCGQVLSIGEAKMLQAKDEQVAVIMGKMIELARQLDDRELKRLGQNIMEAARQ